MLVALDAVTDGKISDVRLRRCALRVDALSGVLVQRAY